MSTTIYMVRHGQSPKTGDNERERGLTEQGKSDALLVAELLQGEEIDAFVSSPYRRAVLTIEDLARQSGKTIVAHEDLRELVFAGEDRVLSDEEVYPLVKQMLEDADYALPGGESLAVCRQRAIAAIRNLLQEHEGKKVAVGTHGLVMTLMMGYFDSRFDVQFLLGLSRPDVYKLEFDGEQLIAAQRLWGPADK